MRRACRPTSTRRSLRADASRAQRRGRVGRAGRQRRRGPARAGARAAIVPDVVTDQTSAHDALERLRPAGLSLDEAAALRARDPEEYVRRALGGDGRRTCRRCWRFDDARRDRLRLRQQHPRRRRSEAGVDGRVRFPGFVPAYIRPLFCEGKGPFRWVALSGDPRGHLAHRPTRCSSCSRTTSACAAGSRMARETISSRGCRRASAGWATASAHEAGCAFNELVRSGRGAGADRHRPRPPRHRLGGLALPRDRGDEGRLRRHRRLADPQRAAEHRQPARRGCRFHHGGGVGIGYSLHAGHGRRGRRHR